MLKSVVFLIKSPIESLVDEASCYIKECGYDSSVYYISSFSEEKFVEIKKEVLFATDSGDTAKELSTRGFYVIGISHDQNEDENFEGLKYIFTDIDEVDIDSFVKAYQRYAGLPWEILRTERLIIRETTLDDVDEFYKLYSDPEMTRYMEGLFENPDDEKRYQKDYIEKVYGLMGFGVWTLVRISDGAVIGRAGYSIRNGFEEIELGFLVGKAYQRQGYAYEACDAILEYGKNVLNFDKVQTLVKEENEVSIHICKKLGFEVADTTYVEENIYGQEYRTDKNVSLNQPRYGKYVRMNKFLW